VYPTQQLLPAGMLPAQDGFVWLVLPLTLGDEEYGLLILDHGPGEGVVWETLREQVAAAIRLCLCRA
jgi:hypothetical protein